MDQGLQGLCKREGTIFGLDLSTLSIFAIDYFIRLITPSNIKKFVAYNICANARFETPCHRREVKRKSQDVKWI